MIVMPTNNTGFMIGYLAGKFANSIGLLISPNGWKYSPDVIPYALDNGAYYAFTKNEEWDERGFYEMLDKVPQQKKPLWVACPDKVMDKEQTFKLWEKHSPRIKDMGFRNAFVLQDGMTREEVPKDAEVLFVGGSFEWKWKMLPEICTWGKRVHCGRVNSYEGLWICDENGVESCDGTGWVRGGIKRMQPLINFLEEKYGNGRIQKCLLKTYTKQN
jgi:hypothetical protein